MCVHICVYPSKKNPRQVMMIFIYFFCLTFDLVYVVEIYIMAYFTRILFVESDKGDRVKIFTTIFS